MTIQVREINNKVIWEDFLKTHPEANFLQSWNWGQFYLELGQKVFYRGYYRDEELQGVALLIEEKAKRAKYLILPGGPILEWFDIELVEAWKQDITNLGQQEKVAFIRCRPQLEDNQQNQDLFQKKLNMVSAPMHLQAELTHRLDLNLSEIELLQKMRKSTRYEIKKAQKEGLRIQCSQDPQDIAAFYQLQLETAKRQKFVPFGLEYWRKQFITLNQDNEVILYSTFFQDQLLAQAMIIFYGQEAVYHYGASTELARKYPGAYLIQWEAIKEAKKRGMRRYNFWGVAPEGEMEHRFAKLSVFKRGFGGADFHYLHAHDLVVNNLKYQVNLLIENLRKMIRKV